MERPSELLLLRRKLLGALEESREAACAAAPLCRKADSERAGSPPPAREDAPTGVAHAELGTLWLLAAAPLSAPPLSAPLLSAPLLAAPRCGVLRADVGVDEVAPPPPGPSHALSTLNRGVPRALRLGERGVGIPSRKRGRLDE